MVQRRRFCLLVNCLSNRNVSWRMACTHEFFLKVSNSQRMKFCVSWILSKCKRRISLKTENCFAALHVPRFAQSLTNAWVQIKVYHPFVLNHFSCWLCFVMNSLLINWQKSSLMLSWPLLNLENQSTCTWLKSCMYVHIPCGFFKWRDLISLLY